ncbi:vWA domain-containing protein [Entomomonas asaccharolytica]|uniref:VWA domain-containing protein n=1 Tax=Entomomonas asaccharolytica TaxID=2785331 RepID=A0A974NG77_9GAMM|nr:VWA domain-containing protein [Entomomonas asaccharolytica]QQP85958.1 VWA domain-containing protein [Entomomonas asaccharolytica]
MKRTLFSLLAIPVLSLMTIVSATAAPKIIIKSELASPVILENAQDKNYLKISLTGFPLDVKKRSPINLALVIDRSTSMSGDRIEKARDAAIMTVNMLSSEDTLSVITYDSSAEVIIPATKVTDKEKLIAKIKQNINPRGMTALFAGVSKGINQVNKHLDKEQINRIILLSDGQANVGPTSIKELSELARTAAKKGITISTIGIGEGYNEDLMTAIAGYSDGNHAFVAHSADLEKIFTKEFKDVMSVVAQDVEVIIKTADGVKPVRLLGRDGEITGNTITVKLNQLYSNQEKYVLLEVIPAKGSAEQQKDLAKVQVSYNNLSSKKLENYDEKIAVRYSKSADVVKQAQVDEIVVDSAIQKAAIENERAIQLMDQGKVEEAKAVLQTNAAQMEALPVTAPAARMKAEQSAAANKQLFDKVSTESKASSRKALKESNYKTQKQQQ